MKTSTLHSLITAKALFEDAKRSCASSDSHTATAGLIILQDSLELVFLSLLIEKGIDETKNLESLSFDQLIGDLKATGVKVPKSGTLKALNKERVVAKHYGQIADVTTVKNFLSAATLAIDEVLKQVVGKTFAEIYLTDLIDPGHIRTHLENAVKLYEAKQYLDALIEIRKAVYYSIETEYNIEEWKDFDHKKNESSLLSYFKYGTKGLKADYCKRNKEWIEKHVIKPCDYIQIDTERLRVDALEWGVSINEIENLRRLTPKVIPHTGTDKWHIEYDGHFCENEATESNTRDCLDRAINLIHMQDLHDGATRYPKREKVGQFPDLYEGDPVYQYPRTDSKVVHELSPGYSYRTSEILSGFDPDETYYQISGQPTELKPGDIDAIVANHIHGFLLRRPEAEDEPPPEGKSPPA
jgi:hypothetical protein